MKGNALGKIPFRHFLDREKRRDEFNNLIECVSDSYTYFDVYISFILLCNMINNFQRVCRYPIQLYTSVQGINIIKLTRDMVKREFHALLIDVAGLWLCG